MDFCEAQSYLFSLGNEVEKSRGYIARAEGVEQNRQLGGPSPLAPLEIK